MWDQDSDSAYFSWNGATDVDSWVVLTAASSNSSTWKNVAAAERTGFETTIDLSDAKLDTFVRGKAVDSNGDTLGWTQASNGKQLFAAPKNVKESGTAKTQTQTATTTTATSTKTNATGRTSSTGTGIQNAASSTSSGAAARTTKTVMMEQVYIAAVVVIGGLAMA
jgi:hypothetical protein